MIKIYHAPNTRGIRPIWTCEELGIAYEVAHTDFSPAYRATPEWREKHPVGKLPVMEDEDLRMFESGAMVQYLLDRYGTGQLQPDRQDPAYAAYLQWMWFGEATLSRPLGEIVNHGREFPGDARIEAVVDEMAGRAVACFDAVADHVRDRTYLLGDTFTAADISVGYGIYLGQLLIADRLPADLMDYWERLNTRPAMKAALAA